MAAPLSAERNLTNPLDRLEQLAETRSWQLDRPNDHEIVMGVTGGWSNLSISLTWRDDMESLHFACSSDLRVPDKRRAEVGKLFTLMNAQLMHGHFDLWTDGTICFRHSLLLTGGAEANDAQCEALVQLGVDTMQAYYPAINFVIWAGQDAESALANALLETHGEA